jgi:AcrR family transcriptional regulator
MKKNSPKFRQIEKTAKDLFWKHGMNRVTVEEICERSAVSKMTFYKYFSNKTELAKYILQKLFDEGIQVYRDIMESNKPYVEKIKSIIQMKMDYTGEISQEFLIDLYKGNDPELRKMIDEYMNRNMEMILEDFKKAQEEGNIRADVKPQFLVYILNHLIDVITDKQINSLYNNTQELIYEIVNFFYYGIMPKGDEQ